MLEGIDFPENVREELDAGRLWRAKEILASRIGSMPFSPDACEQYGAVLLETHDLLEAGRYLFLSGRRRTEYEDAIEVFLARHGGASGNALFHALPQRVKGLPLDQLPPNVLGEIHSRGWSEPEEAPAEPRRVRANLTDKIVMGGCIAGLLYLVASMVAGIPVIWRFIASWFR